MIYLGADHGGYELKEKIKQWLSEWGMEYEDCGNTKYEAEDDYPIFAFKVAGKVALHAINNKSQYSNSNTTSVQNPNSKKQAMGILACRSAAGMVICANKVKGIRAVAVFDEESAKHSRTNNDANVIALSGDHLQKDDAKRILKIWIDTQFSGEERHKRRIQEIEKREKEVTQ